MLVVVSQNLPSSSGIEIENHITLLVHHVVSSALFEIDDMGSLGIIVSMECLLLWCQWLHLALHCDSEGVMWELESDVLAELPLELSVDLQFEISASASIHFY